MKKLSAFFILIFLAAPFAFAQSSVWKITKGENFLYLGGSVHALRAQDFPLPKEFETAFEKSDILVFEANISEINDSQFMQKAMQFMMLPQGKTLKTILNKKTYKLLEAKCKELNFPLEYMQNLTPSAIVNIITVMQMQRLGFTPQGVDIYYLTKAQSGAKRMEFLETVEFQMKLLYDFSAIDNNYILQSIDDLDKLKEIMPPLIDEWRGGTSKIIEQELKEMREKFPNLYKTVFADRNKNWLVSIEKYLTTKDVEFIIVGLAHAQSDEGLLKSLKDRGYEVEYVK
jgi:uncharacterized protein YbaP (TraB family)